MIMTVCFEIGGFYLVSKGQNNLYLFHMFTYFEAILYALIFIDLLKGSQKNVVRILLVCFLIFSVINSALWESFIVFNSNQRYLGGVFIIVYICLYFIQIFNEAKIQKIESDPYFWMTAILLIYTAGTLFLFILADEILTAKNNALWDLHSVLNILLNLGFTLTIWMGARKSN